MGHGRNGLMWLGDLGTDAEEGGDEGSEGGERVVGDREGGKLGEEVVVVVEDEVAEVLVEEKVVELKEEERKDEKVVELKVKFFDGVIGEGGDYRGGGGGRMWQWWGS
ncbi:hypothetical protein LIER_41894 [Lithospermum erythrorhizon]|uniref:Uncharacterized protein n=1 Tax=Lithospermum erythrorhizon TaxID=34254 RepID=A0AAV3RGA9_LITER